MSKGIVRTNEAPQPIGPYSQGTLAAGFLFVSGQGAVDPKVGQLVSGDIEAQTRQVLTNIKRIVEAAGLSMSDVVKASIFLSKMDDFKKMNEVYKSFFNENPPARTTVEAKLPLPNMLIEIDVVAHHE